MLNLDILIEVIMNASTKQIMNKRALTSMFMLLSFILLPLSGIPLHFIRTRGGVVVLEHFLMSIHNICALIFTIACVIHLSLNWNALVKYIATNTHEYLRFRKEFIVALIIIVLIVSLFSSHALHTH